MLIPARNASSGVADPDEQAESTDGPGSRLRTTGAAPDRRSPLSIWSRPRAPQAERTEWDDVAMPTGLIKPPDPGQLA